MLQPSDLMASLEVLEESSIMVVMEHWMDVDPSVPGKRRLRGTRLTKRSSLRVTSYTCLLGIHGPLLDLVSYSDLCLHACSCVIVKPCKLYSCLWTIN